MQLTERGRGLQLSRLRKSRTHRYRQFWHLFITVMTYGYASENLLLTHYGFPFYHSKRASVGFFLLYLTFSTISLWHIINHHHSTARDIAVTAQAARAQTQGPQTGHHVNCKQGGHRHFGFRTWNREHNFSPLHTHYLSHESDDIFSRHDDTT